MEVVDRARDGERGVKLPCPLRAPHPPSTLICSPTGELSEPHSLGVLMEASLGRHY